MFEMMVTQPEVSARRYPARQGLKEWGLFQGRYRLLMETVYDIIAFVRDDGVILEISDSVLSSLGFLPIEMIGRNAFSLIHPGDQARARATLSRAIQTPGVVQALDIRFRGKDGEYRIFEVSGRRPVENEGTPVAIIVSRDIDQRRRLEDQIRYRAHFDTLTGLPNREQFQEELEATLQPGMASQAAVLFLDLDGFKVVNDSLGHVAGDNLLRQVATRLRESLREEDTIARLGGDEFAVLIRSQGCAPLHPETTARRLLKALETPFELPGGRLRVGASVGIALAGRGDTSAQDLLQASDVAMYQAKRLEGSRFEWFDAEAHWLETHKVQLAEGLRTALASDGIGCLFAAIHDLETNEVVGAKALPVWDGMEGRALRGEELYTLAREAGALPELMVRVLAAVFEAVEGWKRKGLELELVSVELGRDVPDDGRLWTSLVRSFRAIGGLRAKLALELGDRNQRLPADRLTAIQELGVKLALVGFGRGSGCLVNLHRLRVDWIELSRDLTAGVESDKRLQAVVKSVCRLAAALGARVVARGVETAAQRRTLVEVGCRLGHGRGSSPAVGAGTFLTRALETSGKVRSEHVAPQ